jgi:hypothetical protein
MKLDEFFADLRAYGAEFRLIPKYRCRECGKVIELESRLMKITCNRNEKDTEIIQRLMYFCISQTKEHVLSDAGDGNTRHPIIPHRCSNTSFGMCELKTIEIISINGITPNFSESDYEISRLAMLKKR